MTSNEALERAARIWGKSRVISVWRHQARRLDTTDYVVNLSPAGIASDTRERNYPVHTLDGNGHPTCHRDCQELEAAL